VNLQILLDAVVSIPVLLLVPAAMIDLDEAHAAFDQTAGDETLASEGRWSKGQGVLGFGLVQTVTLFCGRAFLREVQSFGRARLELESQLIAGDARLQL